MVMASIGLGMIALAAASPDSVTVGSDFAPAQLGGSQLGVARTLQSAGRVGERSSVAVGANGLPVISFFNGSESSLRVFACADPGCTSGTVPLLDDDGVVGLFNDIEIGADGLPLIAYAQAAPWELKLYRCADSSCASGASTLLFDQGGVEQPDIEIRLDGRPIISFLDDDSNPSSFAGDLKIYDCSNPACTSGITRTLTDFGGIVGHAADMEVRHDGRPIISYFHEGATGGADLRLYDCADVNCANGTVREVDVAGNVGQQSSMAIRQDGFPIVAYFDDTNDALKLYDCTDIDCVGGTQRVLDASGRVFDTSTTIRDNGLPIISYHDVTDNDLKLYDCDDSTCSSGTVRVLDRVDDVGENGSIAIGFGGLPIISYWDRGNNDLKAFVCADSRCEFNAIDLLIFVDGFEL